MHKRLSVMLVGLLLLIAAAAYAQEAPTATPLETLPPTVISPADAEEVAGGVVGAAEGAAESLTETTASLWDRLLQVPRSEVVRIILIVIGIVLLVAGWVVYDYIILLAGFLIGGLIALSLVTEANSFLTILFFIVGGVIGAALATFVWYLAVFLIGGYIGIALIRSLTVALAWGEPSNIVLLIALIVGGALLLALAFELLILFSAIVGAQMIALGFGLGVEWVIILTILGIILQLVIIRSRGISIRRRPRPLFWRRRPAI